MPCDPVEAPKATRNRGVFPEAANGPPDLIFAYLERSFEILSAHAYESYLGAPSGLSYTLNTYFSQILYSALLL